MKPSGVPADAVEAPMASARLIGRLDGMDVLRDVYGAAAAHDVVEAVDRRLAATAIDGFTVRRTGDGVYAITAKATTPLAVASVAQRLQAVVGDQPIATESGPAVASLSIGAAVSAAARPLSLLRHAATAVAAASRNAPGGRCIKRADGDPHAETLATARRALAALGAGRFALAFQPILRADQPSIVAFSECLARVLEPSGEIVAAGAFIPAMEALRLTRPIDRAVLSLALAELAALPTLRLSVNLSAQSLCDPGWLRILAEGETDSPGIAARLIVEITESAVIADEPRAQAFIAEVRNFGCAIALDDFGAGFSAFRHLKQLRPDILKIDGSFVKGVAHDPANRALIESIMVVARHFEMLTIAEQVNDPADAEILRRLGVDCLQGNSYAQPTIEPGWRAEDWANRAAI